MSDDGYASGSTATTEDDDSSEFENQLRADLYNFNTVMNEQTFALIQARAHLKTTQDELYPVSDDGNVTPRRLSEHEREDINRRVVQAKQIETELLEHLEITNYNIQHTGGLLRTIMQSPPPFMEQPPAGGARARGRTRRRKTTKRKCKSRKTRKKTRRKKTRRKKTHMRNRTGASKPCQGPR